MKRILFLVMFVSATLLTQAQLNNYCDDFQSYAQMRDNRKILDSMIYDYDPIVAYGQSPEMAKFNAKVKALKTLFYNQMYLDNPLVDTIIAQFAGEVVLLFADEYDVYKTKKKNRHLGLYACQVFKIKYNKQLVNFLKGHIDNFLKAQGVFTINPYISVNGDALTKQVYNDAMQKFQTALGASKFKLDGIKELRMLELAELPEKPANYNPCADGFKYYTTDNKYLDYVNSVTNNANRQQNIDIIFSIDSITVTKIPNTEYKIATFHILAVDAHNASIIMIYDVRDTLSSVSDYDCVKNALNTVFTDNADKIMYEMIKRYSNYIRDGVEFTLQICNSLLTNDKIDELEGILLNCNLFVKGSVKPAEWRNLGVSIGKSYTGRTYLLDPLQLKNSMRRMLKDAGLVNFNVDVSGLTYVVTEQKPANINQ